MTIGKRNSNQLSYGLDEQLEAALLAQGATHSELNLPAGIKHEHDFVLLSAGKRVVVEVEKANWEKILRDLLKFHVYFNHGADLALLFLPKRGGLTD